jgi:hypothetical protein
VLNHRYLLSLALVLVASGCVRRAWIIDRTHTGAVIGYDGEAEDVEANIARVASEVCGEREYILGNDRVRHETKTWVSPGRTRTRSVRVKDGPCEGLDCEGIMGGPGIMGNGTDGENRVTVRTRTPAKVRRWESSWRERDVYCVQ